MRKEECYGCKLQHEGNLKSALGDPLCAACHRDAIKRFEDENYKLMWYLGAIGAVDPKDAARAMGRRIKAKRKA